MILKSLSIDAFLFVAALVAGVIFLPGCGTERIVVVREASDGTKLDVTYERIGIDMAVEEISIIRPEIRDGEGGIVFPELKIVVKGLKETDRTAEVASKGFDVVGKLADKIPGLP